MSIPAAIPIPPPPLAGPQLVTKPVVWFKPDPTQPRKHFDEADLALLGASLKNKQLVPILARPNGVIIDGERRCRAANLVGLPTLAAIITDEKLNATQIKEMQLVTAMQRSDLTAYEKWNACAELMCMNPTWQMKDLAESLHLDPSGVTRILSPSKCSPDWQAALKAGKVGLSDCYAASKLPVEEQAGLLAMKLSGASRDQLEAASRKTRNGKPPSEEKASRVKCIVPGKGATVQVVATSSMTLLEMIDAAQEWVKRARRAAEQGWDCKTLERACKDEAKKG